MRACWRHMCQWRIRFTLTPYCWGTCWCGHTCRTWRMWHRRCIMKTTGLSASTKWHKWLCRTGNAGKGVQVRQSLDPLIECWADTLMWLFLLVCLRSIKMTARWIFLCRWSPAIMRGKDWSMKKMKRCVYLSPGSRIFHSCRGFFFLEVLFFPICSWGRCRKCWKGFRCRCIAKKVVIESTKGLRNMDRKQPSVTAAGITVIWAHKSWGSKSGQHVWTSPED